MTTLRIRVNKFLGGRSLRLGAVTDIIPVAAETTPRGRPIRGVVVPVSDVGETRNVDVPPGRYLLQATLPSGELLRHYVDATAGLSSLDVVLESEDSPHEWLGLQHLLGSVPSRAHVERQVRQETQESLTLFAATAPPKIELFWLDTARDNGAFLQWLGAADSIDDNAVRHLVGRIIGGGQLQAQLDDNRFRKFEIPPYDALPPSPVPPVLNQLLGPGGGGGQPRRFVAMLEDDKVRAIGALPHEWKYVNYSTASGGQSVGMDVLIGPPESTRSRKGRGVNRLSINISDPDVTSMLSFLAQGNLQAASAMLELASEWLYGKFENPYAAAAGGYTLVSAQGMADLPEHHWKDWLRNLVQ